MWSEWYDKYNGVNGNKKWNVTLEKVVNPWIEIFTFAVYNFFFFFLFQQYRIATMVKCKQVSQAKNWRQKIFIEWEKNIFSSHYMYKMKNKQQTFTKSSSLYIKINVFQHPKQRINVMLLLLYWKCRLHNCFRYFFFILYFHFS